VAVALNGRSFTDLLALQPGIVPMSTQLPDSIVMAGAQVAIAPSGNLNPGNQSISGQREDANGFIVNGGDVKEMMNGGTTIVPNLDSIAEFRVLTNNFDAEYGNYSGGIVNVVTKSGTNQLHGSGFEFLRNTALDARSWFSPERDVFRQNQFGGTIGGPIKKNKILFFSDYQGTRTNQGVDTGLIPVPSVTERSGNFLNNPDVLNSFESGCPGGQCTVAPCDPAALEESDKRCRFPCDSFARRAVLHGWVHQLHAVRFSEWRISHEGLVRSGKVSGAIHPNTKCRPFDVRNRRAVKEIEGRHDEFSN
jgi:hypothetical protein